MTNEVARVGDPPEPCAFCPIAGGNRALIAVLGVQSVLVVTLVAIGTGLPSAVTTAIGLLLLDALVVGTRMLGQRRGTQAILIALAVLLRILSGLSTPGSTGWAAAR